ncbi:unnamed protein product, partial [Prorocentrum cordatum]
MARPPHGCDAAYPARMLRYVIPASIVGLVAVAWPCGTLVRWTSAALLRIEGQDDEVGTLPLDPVTWAVSVRTEVRDMTPFFAFYALRFFFLECIAAPGFGIAVYHALNSGERHLRITLVASECVNFVLSWTLRFMGLALHVSMSLDFSEGSWLVFGMGVSSVLWLPITSGLFLMLVPRREWLTTLLLNILVTIVSVVVFYGRDVTLNGYFVIEGDLARICVGIVAPAAITMVIMEVYFFLAFHMLQFRCLRSAAVLMGGPFCFGLTLATILQLGSTSVVSGVCIEFGSLLVELRFKYCLLSGTTPLQSLRDRLCCLGRCCSHRKTGRMSFVHPGFDNIVSLDPTVLGAQQASSGERAGETHGDAGPCSKTLDNDGPEK